MMLARSTHWLLGLAFAAAVLLVGLEYLTVSGSLNPLYVVLAICGVPLLLVLTTERPMWLFPLAAALSPVVYAVSVAGAKVIVADIVVGCIILSLFMARPRSPLPAGASRIVRPFLILLGISVISLSVSGNAGFGIAKIVQRAEYLLLFLACASLLHDRAVIRRIVLAYIFAASILALLVLYFGFLHGAVSGPVQVLFLNKNGAGSFLAISVPMIIARVLSASPSHRRIWLALAGIGIIALLLTGSRGAWLGVMVALGVLMARRGGKSIAIYVGALLLLLLAIATVVPPSLTRAGDFTPSAQNGAANTILIRGVIWRDALNLIASHPVLGMGVGGYISYDTYNGDPINFNTNDPHNAILYMWAELGPLGLLVFLWIVYGVLWLGVRADRSTKGDPDHWIAEGSFIAITSYLVFALSEPIWVRGDGLIFFLLVGICANLQSPTKLDETTGGAQGAIIGTPSLGQFRAH